MKKFNKLEDKFLIPPFSVFDTKQQYWIDRRKKWLKLGIKGELGRDAGCLPKGFDEKKYGIKQSQETSIFDPALCEICYEWFNVENGKILDCFAGGSVRGIVASLSGYPYIGIDLSQRQIEANEQQWIDIKPKNKTNNSIFNFVTPIQKIDDMWFKREDLFTIDGVCGGKVRTAWGLMKNLKTTGVVTAGSRSSPQVNIVATLAKRLNLKCRAHTPQGELSPELIRAQEKGAEIIQHKAGYNSVIVARAREDAKNLGWAEIPFGMECDEVINQTKQQVVDIPTDVKRIVITVGSGMSLSGLLWGLKEQNLNIKVLGVCVGANPEERLNKYAPSDWKEKVTLIDSGLDYHKFAPTTNFKGIELDPIYEAKCIPFLESGDLFWIIGIRETAKKQQDDYINPVWLTGDSNQVLDLIENESVDLIFSCPPYFDLEVYSDNKQDLSNMTYNQFLEVYSSIIKKSLDKLKNNRFAVFVVGDVRDEKGFYRNLPEETVNIFTKWGALKYNEIILVNSIGTLPIRAGKIFNNSRKIGKMHQNVLVFFKGDAKKINEIFGKLDLDDGEQSTLQNYF